MFCCLCCKCLCVPEEKFPANITSYYKGGVSQFTVLSFVVYLFRLDVSFLLGFTPATEDGYFYFYRLTLCTHFFNA